MNIIAIDPGPEESAYVEMRDGRITNFAKARNETVLRVVYAAAIEGDCELVIEQVASMGMAVGAEVFETCVWSGQFMREWERAANRPADRITRHIIKKHICHNALAKDANIRQAIIDRYGGEKKGIGAVRCQKCKGKGWYGREHTPCPVWQHEPGPLYGIAADVWQALALAITYAETKAVAA